MCGLTGFARHPEAKGIEATKRVFTELMLATAHRGRHATGIAVIGAKDARVLKRAVSVETFVKSEAYQQELAAVGAADRAMIGHVRYATHNNAHKDEAAHPFAMGKIIGAHNGIVSNWKEVEQKLAKDLDGPKWINDSQAPFGALSLIKNPVKALDLLDGYWALTWMKGKRLFFARTAEAPLTAAYVPETRTLFWNSERKILEKVLQEQGVEATEIWDVKPNVIYSYDPSLFDAKGTNVIKTPASFAGRRFVKADPRTSGRPWSQGGYSTTTTFQGSDREIPAKGRSYSLKEMDERIDSLTDLVAELFAKIDVLEAEKEHIYEVLNSAPELFDSAAIEAGRPEPWDERQIDWVEQQQDARTREMHKAALQNGDESPYSDSDDDPQTQENERVLRAYTAKMKGRKCVACGDEDKDTQGNPLCMTSRGDMHLNCLKT